MTINMQSFAMSFRQLYTFLRVVVLKLILKNPIAAADARHLSAESLFFWVENFVLFPQVWADKHYGFLHQAFFIPYQHQVNFMRQLVKNIDSRLPLIVEKSANMGATSCLALVALWMFLYKEDCSMAIVTRSRKELYDEAHPLSVFQMMLYILKHLPVQILPPDWVVFSCGKKGKGAIRLINTRNGNILEGFCGNKPLEADKMRFFRAVIFDEFAFHRCDMVNYQLLQELGVPQIWVSSPNGTNNVFWDLVHHSKIQRFLLPYYLHPFYDEGWAEAQVAEKGAVYVHQYVHIQYFCRERIYKSVKRGAERKPRRRKQDRSLPPEVITAKEGVSVGTEIAQQAPRPKRKRARAVFRNPRRIPAVMSGIEFRVHLLRRKVRHLNVVSTVPPEREAQLKETAETMTSGIKRHRLVTLEAKEQTIAFINKHSSLKLGVEQAQARSAWPEIRKLTDPMFGDQQPAPFALLHLNLTYFSLGKEK